MNTTTKTVLLLSIISLNSSMFGMLDGIQKEISTRVVSQKRQIVTAIFVPLAAAGGFVLAQRKDDILSLLEKISMPNEKVILGMATAAAMPATYVLLGKFSPEKQFKTYENNRKTIEEHKIFQHKKVIESILQKEEGQAGALLEFINTNFSNKADKYLPASINITNKLCVLQRCIKAEHKRLTKIKDAGKELVRSEKRSDTGDCTVSDISISGQLEQLENYIRFIENFRGKVVSLSAYEKAEDNKAANKKNQLTEDQITFGTKIAAFIPMFIQPVSNLCMVLLQMLFNKFGIE